MHHLPPQHIGVYDIKITHVYCLNIYLNIILLLCLQRYYYYRQCVEFWQTFQPIALNSKPFMDAEFNYMRENLQAI